MFKNIGILGPNEVGGIIAMGGYPCQLESRTLAACHIEGHVSSVADVDGDCVPGAGRLGHDLRREDVW
jgi:hypothetical protein